MLSLSSFVLIPVLTQLVSVITGQLLQTEYLDVKLPRVNACPRAYYDGEDSIFLVGGCDTVSYTEILKFSITSETLEKFGSLPGDAWLGTLQFDNFGNVFFFGGGESRRDVYKYNPDTNRTATVAAFPISANAHMSTKYNESSNTVFIFGGSGQGRELWSFDMETLITSVNLTNLPFYVNGGTTFRVGNKAYIFDDTVASVNKMALELDLETFNLQPVGPPTLPLFDRLPSSVWDGTYAYVIGGYQPNTGAPTDGLIQFDPSTHENNFIPVRNFPVEGLSYFYYAPATIFVPSNNRIYFFGGRSFNYTGNNYVLHDEIFYIDLTPFVEPTPSTIMIPSPTTESTTLNPNLFRCNHRPNGLYPHPTDCSLFIRCQNQEMTVFSCLPPLLFDLVKKSCNYPEVEENSR